MSRTRFFLVTLLTAAVVFLGRTGMHLALEQVTSSAALEETGGRLQLVLDEHDVGLVRSGTPLQVRFAVANAGTGDLSLRQATEDRGGAEEEFRTVTIEPGQTGEVVAVLSSDDLLARGRKHVRFHTNDSTSPDLWLTVRGTAVRQTASP